jgi:hypothetical protein
MASKKKYVQGMESPMGKAYMAAKKEQDGPIESTLEMTEAELKRLIRAADKVILDAADTAKQVPGAVVDAAKTIVGAGIDGAKSAGKSWLGAVKALGSFVGGGAAPGTFMGPAPKKPNPASGPRDPDESMQPRSDKRKPPTKPRPVRGPGRGMPPTLPPSL